MNCMKKIKMSDSFTFQVTKMPVEFDNEHITFEEPLGHKKKLWTYI